MATNRARLPRAPWLIGSILLVLVAVVGGMYLAGAVNAVDEERFALAANSLTRDLEDRIDGFGLLGAALPSVAGPETGLSLDDVFRMVGVGEASIEPSAPVSLPLPGFSGFVIRDASTGALVTYGTAGVDVAGLVETPEMTHVISAAESGGPSYSAPIRQDGHVFYAIGVAVNGDGPDVVLAFIDVEELVNGSVGTDSQSVIDIRVVDTSDSHETILEIGTPPNVPARQTLVSWFNRTLRLELSPGRDFGAGGGPMAGALIAVLGSAIAALIFALGVATRRTAEEQAQQLRTALDSVVDKDRFIASVSHELRTPLTVIMGMSAELANRNDAFTLEERREILAAVAEQSTEMSYLIEDLLVAARSQTDTITVSNEVMNVYAQVETVRDALAHTSGRFLPISPDNAADLQAYGDTLRVRQVVRNLLSNAIRYGGADAGVTIRELGDHLEIEVWDTGEGIEEELRDIVFAPYGRAHTSGTQPNSVGLGLTVARDLVERMGGTITYAYEGHKSRFRVRLRRRHGGGSTAREPLATALP